MRALAERRTTQRLVAEQLGLTVRQVERLYARFKADGAQRLVLRKRGARGNRTLPPEVRKLALELVRGRYADFGPKLAHEKLLELHQIHVSLTTVRAWMIGDGIWITRHERKKRVQQPRYRRACLGELVQIDGCDHDWFEGRGPRWTALVYIDHATSRLMELRFVRSESTFDYFESTNEYLRRHGKAGRILQRQSVDLPRKRHRNRAPSNSPTRPSPSSRARARATAVAQAKAAGGTGVDQPVAQAAARLAMTPLSPAKRRPRGARELERAGKSL